MANINLISARRAEKLRLTRIARGLMITIFGALAAGFLSAGWMGMQLVLARQAIARADAELETLRPILTEIETAERQRLELQPKLRTLVEAQGATARWFGILEGLKRAVPQQTWLTNLSVERNGDGPLTIRVNGLTVSHNRVGETMWRLSQQQEFYAGVDLRYTQTTRLNDVDSIEFELAARLIDPNAPAEMGGTTSAVSSN
jgi:Tfp pilus assembly protein PilN